MRRSRSTTRRPRSRPKFPPARHKIGALAVHEPQNNWWRALGLESPEALLKVFVHEIRLLHPGGPRRGLCDGPAGTGAGSRRHLQGGSNIGAGQVRAADYILVPDIVSKNGNSGGTNVGGMLGGFLPGGFGAIASSINISSKTADVVLTVTNVRTTEQQAMEEGHGSKTDVGFGFGGGWGGWGGFGGAGISNYQNTAIGQVVILAYIDAYTKLVGDLGGLSADAKADAPSQAVTLARPGVMRATPERKRQGAAAAGSRHDSLSHRQHQGHVGGSGRRSRQQGLDLASVDRQL